MREDLHAFIIVYYFAMIAEKFIGIQILIMMCFGDTYPFKTLHYVPLFYNVCVVVNTL